MAFRPTEKLIIAIPYYNNPDLLYRTLDHLKALDREHPYDLTVYISDDASPVAPDMARMALTKNFHYVRQPKNLGLVGNYNWCVKTICDAGPAWSLILDADDRPTAGAIAEVLAFSGRDDIGMVIGGYQIVTSAQPDKPIQHMSPSPATRVLDAKAAFRWFYSHNRAASSGVWIHSDAYRDTTYDPKCHYCCDWDMYIRLAGRSSVVLSQNMFCTVLHHDNNNTWTFMKSGDASRNERETLRKNWPLAKDLRISLIARIILKAEAMAHYFYRSLRMKRLYS